jgi:hypothetical protein
MHALGASAAAFAFVSLPRPPYLGLACDKATILHCERVGLAVFLAQPARAVRARVDGHDVVLRTPKRKSGPYGSGVFWQVFFTDRHAQVLADASRSIPVLLRVTTSTGSLDRVSVLVYVSEGYG